jgi:hypothetical protein
VPTLPERRRDAATVAPAIEAGVDPATKPEPERAPDPETEPEPAGESATRFGDEPDDWVPA